MRKTFPRAVIVVSIGLIGLQVGPGACSAGLVTVSFEGKINGLFGDYTSLSPDLADGVALTASLTYEDTTPLDPSGFGYFGAVIDMRIQIGATTFTSSEAESMFSGSSNVILVGNDVPSGVSSDLLDFFQVGLGSQSGADPSHTLQVNMAMYVGESGVAPAGLTSSNLADASSIFTRPPQSTYVSYALMGATDQEIKGFSGVITSMRLDPVTAAPEPSSMMLAGSGLAGLAAWRRTRRGRGRISA